MNRRTFASLLTALPFLRFSPLPGTKELLADTARGPVRNKTYVLEQPVVFTHNVDIRGCTFIFTHDETSLFRSPGHIKWTFIGNKSITNYTPNVHKFNDYIS